MKAYELIKILEQNPEAEVCYEDPNFGGIDTVFDEYDIRLAS